MTVFKSLFAAAFIAAVPALGHAKIPPEILSAYKAYSAALDTGQPADVQRTAKAAWTLAEVQIGDSKLTGDLAFNYANYMLGEVEDDQVDAARRSMELTGFYGDDATLMYLERSMTEINLLKRMQKDSATLRAAGQAVDYAEANGFSDSTFLAEALTIRAGILANRGRNDKAGEDAERALKIFETASDGVQSAYSIHANLYRGYVFENREETMDAAMSYQTVMEMTDGLDPAEYSVVGTALGRWIHMRNALVSEGKLDEAEQAGLCKCWPYDKVRNEDVKPVRRNLPVVPRKAVQSGYVVVEFDLTDDGAVTNENVVTAWPNYYEKPALKALSRWEYSPRTPEQTNEDRQALMTTFRFVLMDERGNQIW